MDKPLWMWGVFFASVFLLMVFDLGCLHKKDHAIGMRESLLLSLLYISIGLLFGGWIFWQMGFQSFAEYLTGFLVEKSLSLDNIFVIAMVFSSLSIPAIYHHRVLFWGIIGAASLRALMIGLGVHLVERFSSVLYVFAAFLIATGIKMLFARDQKKARDHDPAIAIQNNPVLKRLRRVLPMTEQFHDQKFIVRQVSAVTGRKQLYLTPLGIALITIEFFDLVFAVDSVPAIFTITRDPYIIYTSNIFAILGLRALYFALSAVIQKFYYLKYSLACVLVFIGSKVFLVKLLHLDKFPASISLAVTVSILTAGCVLSLYRPPPVSDG